MYPKLGIEASVDGVVVMTEVHGSMTVKEVIETARLLVSTGKAEFACVVELSSRRHVATRLWDSRTRKPAPPLSNPHTSLAP